MPFGNAQSLTNDELYAITAYVLYLNDIIKEDDFGLNERNFSFMGYQPDTTEWRERYAPEVATMLRDDRVDGVILTPV